jgi:hypothetical protein
MDYEAHHCPNCGHPIDDELRKLPKDLAKAAATLGPTEVRYLVDSYYQLQDFRKASANQTRALSESEEPHDTVMFFQGQFGTVEDQIKKALDNYSLADPMGQWSRKHVGIGPVIAAGLSAHIDITKAPTVGHIWRFAGLDPTVKWAKGQKRPWNADLKVLCWKIGDSFVKFSGRDDCFYGHLYKKRKIYEVERDVKVQVVPKGIYVNGEGEGVFTLDGENFTAYFLGEKWLYGGNAKAAYETLKTKNIKDKATREIYENGNLPPGRLDLRARRYAVKLFLAHWHGHSYKLHYGKEPPLPYPIAHLGHAHLIESPV